MCLYILNIILNNYVKKRISAVLCLWGISMNANEEMHAGYADPDASYPDADPDAT